MSLPSRALIKSGTGELLRTTFVNCGWVMSANNVAYQFMFGIRDWNQYNDDPINFDALVDTDTIEMYDTSLTVATIRSMKNVEQLEKFIQNCWDTAKSTKDQLNDTTNHN